jgi:predicted MFS family arabinose efflux permease
VTAEHNGTPLDSAPWRARPDEPPKRSAPIDAERLDRFTSPASIIAFSISLGIGYIAVPLLALDAGYDEASIGFLLAFSAVCQIVARIQVTWLLARISDRWLICGAAALLGITYALLALSTALPVYVAAMAGLGAARAFYWTGSQTHAVRRGGNAVRALAVMNTLSSIGTVVGPSVGGLLIGVSHQLTLTVASAGCAVAAILGIGLIGFPTYDRRRPEGAPRVWRRPGVDAACWASFAGGGWRALLNSYVPVVLVAGGQSSTAIGALLSLAEGTSIIAAAALVRYSPSVHVGLVLSSLAVGLSLAVVPFVADQIVIAAALLAVSGVGGGLVTTLGPAMAAQSVPQAELPAAISVTGTFRAVGLLTLPAAVAAGLAVAPLAPAMAVAGVGIAVPTLVVDALARRRTPPGVV